MRHKNPPAIMPANGWIKRIERARMLKNAMDILLFELNESMLKILNKRTSTIAKPQGVVSVAYENGIKRKEIIHNA